MLTKTNHSGCETRFSIMTKRNHWLGALSAAATLCIGSLVTGSFAWSAEATVLFNDDFNEPLSAQWDIYAGSAWTSSGWGYVRGGGPAAFGYIFTKTDISSNDYKITTRFISDEGGGNAWYGADVTFNAKNPTMNGFPEAFYALHILTPAWGDGQSYETNSLVLGKHVEGNYEQCGGWYPGGTPEGLLNDFDNKVEISVNGGHFEIFVNDKFAFSCDDPSPIIGGKIGLNSMWTGINRWDYVRVEGLSSGSNFATFNPRAELTVGPKANDDSYWLRGWIKLADGTNGMDPLTEAVTIKVGSFSHTIPAGSFVQNGTSYSFKGPVGPSTLDVKIWPLGQPGTYWFKACLKNGDLRATTLEPQVQFAIGDDQGQATLDVGKARFATGKAGERWLSSDK